MGRVSVSVSVRGVRPIMAPEGVAVVNRVDVWCSLEGLRLVLTSLDQHEEPIPMQMSR